MENLKKISENIKKSLETLTFPSKLMLKETSSMEKEEICPSLLTREKLISSPNERQTQILE